MSLFNLKNKKVLIVDDFDEMRSLVRSMIAPLMPEQVLVAKNGIEAIEQLEKHSFDVVLCDYNLGKGKDGQQILEEARHRGLLNYDAVFLMITAESTSEMVMGAIDYLPDDYVSKPFTKSQLQNRLEKICLKKSSLADLSKAIEQKNYARALTLCEQKLEATPRGNTELLKSKGDVLQKLGRLDEAEDFYESVLQDRDLPWAKMALGQVYFKKEQYLEAEEVFESMVSENPSNVSAIDWLASSQEKQGELKRAQETIKSAIERSPKSNIRQRKLAELATKNGDHSVAEKAFEKAIQEGKHSCFRSCKDYSGLAKSMLQQDRSDDALKVVGRLESEFEESAETALQIAGTSATIYKETGKTEECKQALEKALKLFNQNPQQLDADIALDITDCCLATGNTDKAGELIKHLVSNNMDDAGLLEKAKDIYAAAGMADLGEQIISQSKDDVVRINNEGARLLKEGKLEESIDFFMKAVKGMPNNATINLNAAFSIIKQIEKTGKVQKYYSRALKYLEQAHEIDPNNAKYYQLLKTLQGFTQKAA